MGSMRVNIILPGENTQIARTFGSIRTVGLHTDLRMQSQLSASYAEAALQQHWFDMLLWVSFAARKCQYSLSSSHNTLLYFVLLKCPMQIQKDFWAAGPSVLLC